MPRFVQSKSETSKSSRASERHKLGAFYTPSIVASHALKETLTSLTAGLNPNQILKLRVIDPSFGDGVFLETVLEHFLGRIEIQVDNFERSKWAKKIQEQCLFGADINPSRSHIRPSISKSNLYVGVNSLLSAWAQSADSQRAPNFSILNCPLTGSRAPLEVEVGRLLKIARSNGSSSKTAKFLFDAWLSLRLKELSFADLEASSWTAFLNRLFVGPEFTRKVIRKVEATAARLRFFHWDLAHELPAFDLVCGNPPWEVIEAGDSKLDYLPRDASYSAFVSEQYGLPTGRRTELAAAFTNLAFRLLNFKGKLSFLLPSSLTNAKTYEKIREVSFDKSAQFNRFDNSSGIFEGLDKRCDFTCLNIDFGKRKSLLLSSSTYLPTKFIQVDMPVGKSSNVHLLSGPERVVPNFRDRESSDVIGKILSKCSPFESFNQRYETWNGLNSTTDRHLLRSKQSAVSVPVTSGQGINTLTLLCRDGAEATKFVSREAVSARGTSNLFGKNMWEVDRIGWRKIARADDTRTLIVSPVPAGVVNMESLWTIAFEDKSFQLWCEFIWSSIPFDAVARTIVNSNVSKFILLGLPIPPLDSRLLAKYRKLRLQFAHVRSNSAEYFALVKEVNSLAFEAFQLNRNERNQLITSCFNANHPVIAQITDVDVAEMGVAA